LKTGDQLSSFLLENLPKCEREERRKYKKGFDVEKDEYKKRNCVEESVSKSEVLQVDSELL
jgi:hypothetical protein